MSETTSPVNQTPSTVHEPQPLFGSINYALAHLVPVTLVRHLRRDLARCGKTHPQHYENYLAFRNFVLFSAPVALGLWCIVLDERSSLVALACTIAAITVIMTIGLVRVSISNWGEYRVKRIAHGLPDGLDLVAMGMNGGLSFLQALQHAARELYRTHPELASEFELIQRQAAAGSVDYALKRFGERMDWADIQPVLNALSHAIQSGTSLRLSLEELADQMRRDRMRRLVQRANRNGILMLFPIIFCLAPAALLLIFAPPVIKLREFRRDFDQDRQSLSPGTRNQAEPRR